MTRPKRRLVPLLGGALSVVLVAVGSILAGESPSHHASGAEIRAMYDSETRHQIAAFLVALGAVPLLFFAGYARAVLARLRPPGGVLADVALAGAVVAAAGLGVQAMGRAAVAEAAQTPELGDEVLQSLNALEGWSFYPFAIGLATFLLASGVALARDRDVVAPAVGWTTVALGVLTLVPIVGLVAVVPAAIWVVVLSVVLFARANDASLHEDELVEVAETTSTEAVGHAA